jgi:hypothetical protein
MRTQRGQAANDFICCLAVLHLGGRGYANYEQQLRSAIKRGNARSQAVCALENESHAAGY